MEIILSHTNVSLSVPNQRLNSSSNQGDFEVLEQNWNGMKPVFSVCSGGLHPGIMHRLMELLSTDIVVQAGGGVLGHPKGTQSGAKALRQAIDAYMQGTNIQNYAKNHQELAEALALWGDETPI